MITLTEKEKMLIEDEKSHEELCIKKYSKYINEAEDPALKQLFASINEHEKQHLNTLNTILSGQIPNMNNSQGQQNNQNSQNNAPKPSDKFNQNDSDICNDALTTEKFVSSTYNTTIFEVKDHNIRSALNHIQKEEQEHGEQLYNYMASKGYYNTK
ncbi:MAG: spore coat protein [Clostridiaceae bacterium]